MAHDSLARLDDVYELPFGSQPLPQRMPQPTEPRHTLSPWKFKSTSPQKEKQSVPETEKTKSYQSGYEKQRTTRKLIGRQIEFLVIAGMVLIGGLLIVSKYATNYVERRELNKIKNELVAEQTLTNDTITELEREEFSQRVLEDAKVKLGMVLPGGSSVIEVTHHPVSSTVSYLETAPQLRSIQFHWFGR